MKYLLEKRNSHHVYIDKLLKNHAKELFAEDLIRQIKNHKEQITYSCGKFDHFVILEITSALPPNYLTEHPERKQEFFTYGFLSDVDDIWQVRARIVREGQEDNIGRWVPL